MNVSWRVAAAVLLVQNLLVFGRHYFLGYAFPWDFLGPYHAVPYYWIEAMRHGAGLGWIPFQGMGYPMHLNLQSGLEYPPLWWWVAVDRPYSLHSAVVLQGLHVGVGAAGAMICARMAGASTLGSLLAGVFFQGFGAFYSNAEHVDIVRASALLPWLAAPVFARTEASSRRRLAAFVALQPLLVYALWTGGYLGLAVAALFVLGFTLVLRAVCEPAYRRTAVLILAAQAIGCALAAVFLLPAVLEASEFARLARAREFDYGAAVDLLGLFLRAEHKFFQHDLSMRSSFIGLPALALLLIGLRWARAWNPWVITATALALLMACGLLHQPLAMVVPPIGYSRFPFGEYRIVAGLGFILLAAQSFDRVWSDRHRAWWSLAFAAIVGWGLLMLANEGGQGREIATLAAAAVLTVALLLLARRVRAHGLAIALIVLFALDWARVQWNQFYWTVRPTLAREDFERGVGALRDVRPTLVARMRGEQNGAPCRPARSEAAEDDWRTKRWRGYYNGDYMMEDTSGPMQLARQQRILAEPTLRAFAREPWRAISLAPDAASSPAAIADAGGSAALACTRYATDRIEYRVVTAAEELAVENEVYFPGWSARMVDVQGSTLGTLEAQDRSGFRAWRLPAGSYTLVAEYHAPAQRLAVGTSLAALLAWGALTLVIRRAFSGKVPT